MPWTTSQPREILTGRFSPSTPGLLPLFNWGGELLPLAAEKARAALVLLAALPELTPEQRSIRDELTEYMDKYMDKSGCH